MIHDFGGWSPDGTRIAFAANDRSDEAHFDVFVRISRRANVAVSIRDTHWCGLRLAGRWGSAYRGSRSGLWRMSVFILDTVAGDDAAVPQPGPTIGRPCAGPATAVPFWRSPTTAAATFCASAASIPKPARSQTSIPRPGRDVEAWAISSDSACLATIENDRGLRWCGSAPPMATVLMSRRCPRVVAADLAFSQDGERLALPPPHPPSRKDSGSFGTAPLARSGGLKPDAVVPALRTGLNGPASIIARIPGWLALAAGQSAARRLAGRDLGPWRPGRADTGEFPPRNANAAGAGLRRPDAQCARQLWIRTRLVRKR